MCSLPCGSPALLCHLCVQSWGAATANVHIKVTPAYRGGVEEEEGEEMEDEEEQESVVEGKTEVDGGGEAIVAHFDSAGKAAVQPQQPRQEALHGHG